MNEYERLKAEIAAYGANPEDPVDWILIGKAEDSLELYRELALFIPENFWVCYQDLTAKQIIIACENLGLKPLDDLPKLTEKQRNEITIALI